MAYSQDQMNEIYHKIKLGRMETVNKKITRITIEVYKIGFESGYNRGLANANDKLSPGQNLFKALTLFDWTPLESEMQEIIEAVKKDNAL